MSRRLLLAGLLAVSTQGFVPAPIQWGGRPAQRFVLAPSASPTSAATLSQQLRVWDIAEKTSPIDVPYFAVNADQTITWDGLCMEASGASKGDAVRLGHCSGGPNGLWDILPEGGKSWIRLKDSQVCLSVNDQGGLRGAPVELQGCEDKLSESWKLEEPLPFPAQRAIRSSSMQSALISFISIAAIGALSLTAWLWRWSKPREVTAIHNGLPVSMDQDGVCLSTPPALTERYQGSVQRIVPAAMAINPIPSKDGRQPNSADHNPDRVGSSTPEETNPSISRVGALGAGLISLIGAPMAAFAARSGGRMGGRVGGRVGGRAPMSRPSAPSSSYSSSSRTNVYVTPQRSTNIYVSPGGGYGYGGYGYGYGGGFGGGYGGGYVDGTYLGLSLINSIVQEEQRRRYIEQQLKTQQELGKDQAMINQLQSQLQQQNAKIDGLRSKAGPEETEEVKKMQQKLEDQQKEIEQLRKNQK